MTFSFKPAVRQQVPLLIGLVAGTGGGKTWTAMNLAKGICGKEKFAVICTENGRSLHYADNFQFDYCRLDAPYTPDRYAEAIIAADKAGYKAIVVDSMSHVWAGDGGVLDMQEQELDRMAGDDWKKRESCKMAAWIKPKMSHKKMMQKLLQVKAHVILCFRAEPKVEMTREGGKTVIQAKQSLVGLDGWIPICDKMLPFELTVSFLLTADKPGYPKPIKLQEQHRAMFPLDQPIDERSGARIAEWAAGGTVATTSIKQRLKDALTAAGVPEDEFLTKTNLQSLEDVEEQHVDKALAWIAKRGISRSATIAAKKAPEPSPGKVTLDWIIRRFEGATDLALLNADAALIAELPESEREAAQEVLDFNVSRIKEII